MGYGACMDANSPDINPSSFSLRSLFVVIAFLSLLCAAFRVDPVFGVVVLFVATVISIVACLIRIMFWFRWSDMAMTTCTMLIWLGSLIAMWSIR